MPQITAAIMKNACISSAISDLVISVRNINTAVKIITVDIRKESTAYISLHTDKKIFVTKNAEEIYINIAEPYLNVLNILFTKCLPF